MVASYETIEEIIKIIQRHVDPATFQKIVTDLRGVRGNSSFEATISRLYNSVMNESRKRGPNKVQ